jgi:transposase
VPMSGTPVAPLRLRRRVRVSVAKVARQREAPHIAVVRARIVLDAVEGFSNAENARRNGVSRTTVERWRARMEVAPKVSTLADAPRSGRPARIPLIVRAELLKLACARPKPEESIERAKARQVNAKAAVTAATKKETLAKGSKQELARLAKVAENEVRKAKAAAKAGCVDARARIAAAAAARKARRKALAKADKQLARLKKKLNTARLALAVADKDLARACTGVPVGFSAVWDCSTLQQQLLLQTGQTMSLSEIGRTLRCGGLRPHRVRIWLHSPDPDFQSKAKAICNLYLSPPPGATVLCFDEKPGMQAREERHPIHVAKGGDRREFEYIRHGTSTLLAAYNVKTGQVFGSCRRRTAAGVATFFEQLARKYPTGDVYVVLDNLNVHRGPAINKFLAKHGGRFHFVYTPLHASWLNQVEVWFGILQRRVLRYGSFTSRRELEAAVLSFIRHWNLHQAHPFRWRFRGDFEPRALPWAA